MNRVPTLAESLSYLADQAGRSADALQRIANHTGTGGPPSDPREEVIIGWGVGLGTLRADNKGITFLVDMFTLEGAPYGTMIISSETTVTNPADLINPPPMPKVIPADPNPVEHIKTQSYGKAQWTFPDGSSLTAIGVGNSNLMFLSGSDVLTAEALAMTIAGGTGRYENARGLWTANRSVLNPPGASGSLLTAQGVIRQKQLHTIRVVRGVDLRPAPPPPPAPEADASGGGKEKLAPQPAPTQPPAKKGKA